MKNKLKQFKVPEIYKPLLIVMLMSVIQQFSGMSILRAYVVKIFNNIFQDDQNLEDPSLSSKLNFIVLCTSISDQRVNF